MIAPQLAKEAKITSLEAFILDDDWVIEQKLDGHRVMLRAQPGGAPLALTRGGALYSKKIPKAILDFRFPEGEWVIDGELVGDTYWAFDMPISPLGIGMMGDMPLYQRRVALGTLLKNTFNPFEMVPQARTQDEKIALSTKAIERNFEGLVLKKADAPYRSGGRTDEWLKVKFVTTADVVVLDVRDDGKDSVRLGIVGDDGLLRDIGRSSLIGKEKLASIHQGDVLEVRYLYVGANGRLYQPTIVRKRTDKLPKECTDGQLKHVCKEVLEAL